MSRGRPRRVAGEPLILALEVAEELVAVATLLEEHARDALQPDRTVVEHLARLIGRHADAMVERIGTSIGDR